MAIFRPGGVAGSVSGAVGGFVYVNGRSGPVLRKRPSGRVKVTQAAQLARGMTGRIAAAWNALTEVQRQAWRTAAAALRFPNRLGVLRPISGFQLYTMFTMDVYLGSPPAGLAPPAQSLLYSPTLCNAHFLEGGPYALTTWGLPLGGTSPVEYAYLQRRRAATQLTGFNAQRRIASYTHPVGTKDLFALCSAAGLVVFDGTPFAAAARWQVGGGYVGIPINAVGTVGAVPFTVADFETLGITPWTVVTGSWSVSPVAPHSGVNSLRCVIGAVPTFSAEILSFGALPLYPVRGHVFQYWLRWDAGVSSMRMWFGASNTVNNYAALYTLSGTVAIARLVGGVSATVATVAGPVPTNGQWYRMVISWGYAGTMSITLFDSGGTQLATASGSDSTYSAGAVGFRMLNVNNTAATGYFDDVTVTARAA